MCFDRLAYQPIGGYEMSGAAAVRMIVRLIIFGLLLETRRVQQTANCKTKVRCLICTARVSYEMKLAALASNRSVWAIQVVLAKVRRLMQFVRFWCGNT